VVGGGNALESFREQAFALGVGDRVDFKGYVQDEDLPGFFQMADVFVMPSKKEGFGIVYLEAMACGLPVVAVKAGGSPDALDHGRLGWLAEPDSPISLANAIEEALLRTVGDIRSDPQKLSASVKQLFGSQAFLERLKRILLEVTT
jgi:glycosyltransferase involved in cell wall biosynthesis